MFNSEGIQVATYFSVLFFFHFIPHSARFPAKCLKQIKGKFLDAIFHPQKPHVFLQHFKGNLVNNTDHILRMKEHSLNTLFVSQKTSKI